MVEDGGRAQGPSTGSKSHSIDRIIEFRYEYRFANGVSKEFVVQLDCSNLDLVRANEPACPEWTALSFHQCPNCSLNEAQHPCCPVAGSLHPLIDFFKDFPSFTELDVAVHTKQRTYSTHTTLQHAVSSLIGIFMVTAGCPILNKLRPMVHTHLPFMNPEETAYRMISMYLTAQYFRSRRGKPADWDLEQFVDFLDEVAAVNTSFCRRLNAIRTVDGDVSVNAVNILNSLGQITRLSIEDDVRTRLGRVFEAYCG